MTWHTDAACHPDHKPAHMTPAEWTDQWFTPPDHIGLDYCDGCPVREECGYDGRSEVYGTWGGKPEHKRPSPIHYRRMTGETIVLECRECGHPFLHTVSNGTYPWYCSDSCRSATRARTVKASRPSVARTVKASRPSVARPPRVVVHGTLSAYKYARCRCDDCKAAKAASRKKAAA